MPEHEGTAWRSAVKSLRTEAKVDVIPVDFLADPDGFWEYESLARSAGFVLESRGRESGLMAVGALTEPFEGFPEGAAVVTLTTDSTCAVALVDCTASMS
jgi:hypothetical protein